MLQTIYGQAGTARRDPNHGSGHPHQQGCVGVDPTDLMTALAGVDPSAKLTYTRLAECMEVKEPVNYVVQVLLSGLCLSRGGI